MRNLLTTAANPRTAVLLLAVEVREDGSMRGLLIAALIPACMKPIPLTPAEQCAANGMYLTGISVGTSNGFAVGASGTWGSSSGYAQGVSCQRPTTKEQACEVEAYSIGAGGKLAFATTGRNAALAVGWAALIVPGFIMYEVFAGQRADTELEAKRRGKDAYQRCMTGEVSDAPEGFFCAATTTGVGFCTRSRAQCESARDRAVAQIPELQDCDFTDQAWCSGDRCAPSESACESIGTDCEQRR